ncbi:MAG: hypothetical protein JSU86_04495, partial [Phycisphaerales bacterium]
MASSQAQECCVDVCCAVGHTCCGGTVCCEPDKCCNGEVCCNEACEECLDNGYLSDGSIDVSPDPACLNDTITFTVSGVVDSGGLERENCVEVPILPGPIHYEWTIIKPDGST